MLALYPADSVKILINLYFFVSDIIFGEHKEQL